MRIYASSTNQSLSLASEHVCKFPGAMLYDHSRAGFLSRVFGDALLDSVEFVGMGERRVRVVDEFEFRVEKGGVERGGDAW